MGGDGGRESERNREWRRIERVGKDRERMEESRKEREKRQKPNLLNYNSKRETGLRSLIEWLGGSGGFLQ